MSLTDALDRYFAAWNDHDPDAVAYGRWPTAEATKTPLPVAR